MIPEGGVGSESVLDISDIMVSKCECTHPLCIT